MESWSKDWIKEPPIQLALPCSFFPILPNQALEHRVLRASPFPQGHQSCPSHLPVKCLQPLASVRGWNLGAFWKQPHSVCLRSVYVKFSLLQKFTNTLPVTNHHWYSFLWSELLCIFPVHTERYILLWHACSLIHADPQGIHPGAFLNIQVHRLTMHPSAFCKDAAHLSPSLVMFSQILSLWLFLKLSFQPLPKLQWYGRRYSCQGLEESWCLSSPCLRPSSFSSGTL